MKILMISRELPSLSSALTFRVLNSIEYLSQKHKHNITLVSFKYLGSESKCDEIYLKKFCDKIETVDIPASFSKRITCYTIDCVKHIVSGDLRSVLDYSFSCEMQMKISELLKREKFDVIFVDTPYMLFYVSDVNLPKVLEI